MNIVLLALAGVAVYFWFNSGSPMTGVSTAGPSGPASSGGAGASPAGFSPTSLFQTSQSGLSPTPLHSDQFAGRAPAPGRQPWFAIDAGASIKPQAMNVPVYNPPATPVLSHEQVDYIQRCTYITGAPIPGCH